MGIGVATANSILVVSFARDRLREGVSAATAALDAGFVRFRPVLMTALAMVIGMLPMSLGLGEGGEQNAPLGRAVIADWCLPPSRRCYSYRWFSPRCTGACGPRVEAAGETREHGASHE